MLAMLSLHEVKETQQYLSQSRDHYLIQSLVAVQGCRCVFVCFVLVVVGFFVNLDYSFGFLLR